MGFSSNWLLTCVLALIIYIIYIRLKELNKEYTCTLQKYTQQTEEIQQLKYKVNDLQTYKDDVSKTFQILDNELRVINNQLIHKQLIEAPPSVPSVHSVPSAPYNIPFIQNLPFIPQFFQEMNSVQSHSQQTHSNFPVYYQQNLTDITETESPKEDLDLTENVSEIFISELESDSKDDELNNNKLNQVLKEENNENNLDNPHKDKELLPTQEETIQELKQQIPFRQTFQTGFSNFDLENEDLSSHLNVNLILQGTTDHIHNTLLPNLEFSQFKI